MKTCQPHNRCLVTKVLISLILLPVFLFFGCNDNQSNNNFVPKDPPVNEGELSSGWVIGTLENDVSPDKIWKEISYMAGSNVACQSSGNVFIYVDEEGSVDFDGNPLRSEAGGIVYSLESFSTIIGTYEVTLEIPQAYPTFDDGLQVTQSFGIFEKDPEDWRYQQGAYVDYGHCPGGVGGHHISFGDKGESILKPTGVAMGFKPIDRSLKRKVVTIMMEIKSASIEFSSNGEAPYFIYETNTEGVIPSDFELRIMTHASDIWFGTYDPAGAPYLTEIMSVKINGEEIPLCQ